MLVDAAKLEGPGVSPVADVVVVGAGPGGISLALDLARSGVDVTLVESGHVRHHERIQRLGDAAELDPQRHAPMSEATRRQLGGASVIWGGRCVPYDRIDFERRSFIPHSDWPVGYDEIAHYHQRACDYFRIGRPIFNVLDLDHIHQKSIVPGLPDGDVLSSELERWSLPTDFGREYRRELARTENLRVLHGLTCTDVDTDESGAHVTGIVAKTLDGRTLRVTARRAYVLACGGLETTRLLLASDRRHPGGIGNHSGLLGRFYMGHISGHIARVQFTTPPRETIFGYDRDTDGVYLRRRLSFSPEFQKKNQLTNIVAWLVNAAIADPAHGNGVLSFAYLALASPFGRYFVAEAIRKAAVGHPAAGRVSAHFRNMLRDLPRTLWFIPGFGYRRFLAYRRVPGFFQYNASNSYVLHYHGEHVPNPQSRVTLSEERDALGMRRLKIDLRFQEQDVDSVVRAHQYWDEYLRRHDCGFLEYADADPRQSAWDQAGDGFHQAGTTRMAADPKDGVVDPQSRVHGVDNLFICSSSNLVTSGQANSTFVLVAFGLRLADHLRQRVL